MQLSSPVEGLRVTTISAPAPQQRAFHSSFGGLWIDGLGWKAELDAKVVRREIARDAAVLIPEFVRDGMVILRGAASAAAIDAFQNKIARSFREGNERLLYQKPGVRSSSPVGPGVERRGTRIVDAYAIMPEARQLFDTPQLVDFLSAIFCDYPLLFQSLSFDQGSEQGLHQDTAYVVVDRPLEMAACWIALEDVKAGAGELMYVPGSHRYPDFTFNGKKHFDPIEDGNEIHQQWAHWIHAEAVRRGLSVQTFMAKRGDILIWHADLAHGGSPIIDASLTRQSLVGHFCPAQRRPHYFSYASDRAIVKSQNRLRYCSYHYDLSNEG